MSETVIVGRVEAVGSAQWNTPDGEPPARADAEPDKVFRLIRVAWTRGFGVAVPNPTVAWIKGGQIGCSILTHGDYSDDPVGHEYVFFLRSSTPAGGVPDVPAVLHMWPILDGQVTTLVGTTIPVEELARRIRTVLEEVEP